MSYSRLRAIETRRWVVRSANTGISCFIDEYGQVHDAQPWDKEAAIKMDVPKRESRTIFVRFGDVLSRIFLLAAFVILGYSYYRRFSNRVPK
jgi:apolipoprotein N-acyltransferase